MILLELSCVAIVGLYLASTIRQGESVAQFGKRFGILCATAWCAEDSCIRLYRFYHYAPDWSFFVDQTPLLITIIWPVVLLTAQQFAVALGASRRAVPFCTGAIVVADAALIEPIAVASGLWRWTEPGLFSVPPIGVLGWGIFAVAASYLGLLGPRARDDENTTAPVAPLGVLLLTHGSLLAFWWGGFRWVNQTWDPTTALSVLALGVLVLLVWVVQHRVSTDRLSVLVDRIPGAVFFFVLLTQLSSETTALYAYAGLFPPVYLAITWQSYRRHRQHSSEN